MASPTGYEAYSVEPESPFDPDPRHERHWWKRRSRNRNSRKGTEFHRALFSFGKDDQTAKLSDSEFNDQLIHEVGDLFNTGCAHLRTAMRSVTRLFV